MNSGLYDYFYNKGGIFSLNITAENKDLVIEQTLQESNLPDSLNSLLTSIVDKFLVNHPDGLVISEALSHTITTYACYAIAFIALFIVIRVLAIFLTKLFSFVEKLPVIGFLNKVFPEAVEEVKTVAKKAAAGIDEAIALAIAASIARKRG